MMKKWLITVFVTALLIPAVVMGEGAVLMLELPENAQMIENIAFEDGDFIQTYQLEGDVKVQLLRYAAFDMTLEELAHGEWAGYESAEQMALSEIGGYPAQGMRLVDAQGNQIVYLLRIEAQEQKLILQAVFPSDMGAEQASSQMNEWIETMNVFDPDTTEVG